MLIKEMILPEGNDPSQMILPEGHVDQMILPDKEMILPEGHVGFGADSGGEAGARGQRGDVSRAETWSDGSVGMGKRGLGGALGSGTSAGGRGLARLCIDQVVGRGQVARGRHLALNRQRISHVPSGNTAFQTPLRNAWLAAS